MKAMKKKGKKIGENHRKEIDKNNKRTKKIESKKKIYVY